ncbi:HEAT repeat domain-containing protein [Pseudofrankia inefficax]|uniref:Putative signal transduction protein with Nacht domain n=1 Tax=Pseudofrankia inefficax (strain DSM 45817 / CECT 9037 / DDB 130130 / EuI1c) TaxID=298654 RepID=E3J6F3_PSEI1|nr:HEAT repeat domain-containing protein [Pseudofrankia inefficax]ADP80729.1 putative signal transduction protein with Nacht domain [Pseudofrankia inefficax]
MTWTVVLATAPGEGALAEAVAGPLRGAGYAVWHEGEVLVGESLVEEAARALTAGGPVVLCGTVRAVGTRFARRLVRAAQARSDRVRVFPLLMDSEADVESLTFAERVADYWRDPAAAMDELLAALARHYPQETPQEARQDGDADLSAATRAAYLRALERRYRRLELDALTPEEQDEHLPILLRNVFVPQNVRAAPPPLELSKELVRRLAEAGDIPSPELPHGFDAARLARAWSAYRALPAEPVLDVVRAPEFRRLVLLGDPGSGKSTLIRFLVLALSRAPSGDTPALAGWEGWLPLVVDLRDYADQREECPSFLDYWDRLAAADEGLGLRRAGLEAFLRDDGRALVLFDGLDELFDPRSREAVARQIAGFAARHPNSRVIVTSRIVGYRRSILEGDGFAHFTLQDLDPAQIQAFAGRWFDTAVGDRPDEARLRLDRLNRAIGDSASIRELAGNPLLLTVLVIIARRRELPRERRKVYEHAANVLVEQWDPGRHLPPAALPVDYITADDRREMLRRVARRLQTGRRGLAGNHIRGADLVDELATYLVTRYQIDTPRAHQCAALMVDQFRSRNFVLSRFGTDVYGFVHRAFLEYFCADDIVQRFEKTRELDEVQLRTEVFGRHWDDDAWREVLLLVIGTVDVRVAGPIVSYLAGDVNRAWQLRSSQLPAHLLFAVDCLAELANPAAAVGAGADVLKAIIQLARMTPVGLGRGSSLYPFPNGLVVAPSEGGLGPAWPGREAYRSWFLSSGRYVSRRLVAEFVTRTAAILLSDDPRIHSLIRARASKHPLARLRVAAVEAMAAGWPDRPDTAAFVRRRAVDDQDDEVRRAALAAVAGWPDDPATGPFLRERAVQDEDKRVRAAAVAALGAAPGDPATLEFLRDRAVHDGAGSVREAAVRAAADGTWAAGGDGLAWLCALSRSDGEPDVRRAALEGIGRHGRGVEDARVALCHSAVQDEDDGVRQTAVRALAEGFPDHPDTLPLLYERAVEDSDTFVRGGAVHALATHGRDSPRARAFLLDRLGADPDGFVRVMAVWAIARGWPDHPDTRPCLVTLVRQDVDPFVRSETVKTVARSWTGDPATLALVRDRAVHDDDPAARADSLGVLAARWPGVSGLAALLLDRAARDEAADVREAAIRAVTDGWYDDPATLALLRDRAVRDPHWQVRRTALEAIVTGWLDDAGTLELVRDRAARDDGPEVRVRALQAIATDWHTHPETPPLLRDRAARDPDGQVRAAAAEAIAAGWPDDGEAHGLHTPEP